MHHNTVMNEGRWAALEGQRKPELDPIVWVNDIVDREGLRAFQDAFATIIAAARQPWLGVGVEPRMISELGRGYFKPKSSALKEVAESVRTRLSWLEWHVPRVFAPKPHLVLWRAEYHDSFEAEEIIGQIESGAHAPWLANPLVLDTLPVLPMLGVHLLTSREVHDTFTQRCLAEIDCQGVVGVDPRIAAIARSLKPSSRGVGGV